MKTLFNKYRSLFFAFLFIGILAVMVPLALGVNDSTSGWKIDPGTVRTITAISTSTQLTVVNSSTVAYFVPSRTDAELLAFENHRPINVETGYCGDTLCNSKIGETACNGTSVGTCPQDCGVCTQIAGLVNSNNPWFAYNTGLGAICGDGKCNTNLGETSLRCPVDCSASKGCCAVKNASPSNTSILINCGLYTTSVFAGTSNVTACGNKSGCKVYVNTAWTSSSGVCGRDTAYDYNNLLYYTLGGGTVPAQNATYKTCADITDPSVCSNSGSCIWVGQSDSPSCSNYCGSGHDNNPSDTPLVCAENYFQSGPYYANYLGYTCGNGDKEGNEISGKFCPSDYWDNTKGIVDTPTSGCGDGVCDSSELGGDGSSNYCYIDCGYNSTGGNIVEPRVDWGLCSSFASVCPTLSQSDCVATHICSWSGSCSLSSSIASSLATSNCSLAKTRVDCNRVGCYWDKKAFKLANTYCGDGTCQSGETETTCPADCKVSSNRSYYCQGKTECAGKADAISCGAVTGCQWAKAGTITN